VGRATSSSKAVLDEPGSFRDRDSKVFYDEHGVLRALTERGLDDWDTLAESNLYQRFSQRGQLVDSELIDGGQPEWEGWAGLLRHERIPFVSYPYEWTYSMLRDAALLQLDLLLAGLDEQLTLKDGSPYNVQWRGTRPVFIDIGSFERLRPGEPWAGYRQFCMLYLYPLLLQTYRGLPFQPWLRGSLEGIEPSACRRMLRLRDFARRGVLSHVLLHARLEQSNGDRGGSVRRELEDAGFNAQILRANAKRLRSLVARLEARTTDSAWTKYRNANTYSEDDHARKDELVRRTARAMRPDLVWDIGCNDGRFSRIAAEHATYTVAMDQDEATVDRLYRSLVADDIRSVLPLVVDVSDPSPALGWRNRERKTLLERGSPDLTLCLAVVHHLAITGNIPLRGILEWLRSLDSAVLIEFPAREDPMVRDLLDAKRAGTHEDYCREGFEATMSEYFNIETQTSISETRMIFHAYPRQ
jgi:hypothetical protein